VDTAASTGCMREARLFRQQVKMVAGQGGIPKKMALRFSLALTTGLWVALASPTSACANHSVAEHAVVLESAAPPTAQPATPDPRIGAVYIGSNHLCTGSVLDSPAGDLILTAGHCVPANQRLAFVAGLSGTTAPEDFWHIDEVYLDPRWLQFQDPLADFAIARVSRDTGGSVEGQVGAGLNLGAAPKPGDQVTLTGYAVGVDSGPLGCRAITAAPVKGFPEADCAHLPDGTSGAPWLVGSTISGLIGGLDGGGCEGQIVNYSPRFDDSIKQLLARAEAGGPGDSGPVVNGDAGCP
jgi:hypothetical protein